MSFLSKVFCRYITFHKKISCNLEGNRLSPRLVQAHAQNLFQEGGAGIPKKWIFPAFLPDLQVTSLQILNELKLFTVYIKVWDTTSATFLFFFFFRFFVVVVVVLLCFLFCFVFVLFCFVLFWFGLVWVGLGWVGLVWFGLVWFGLVWFGLVWFGLVWFGLVWFGFGFGFFVFCSFFVDMCFVQITGNDI